MNSVPVLPKDRFWEMISFEFHLKNRREKTRKPLWLPGFQPRYLFRCCLLYRAAEKDIMKLLSVMNLSYGLMLFPSTQNTPFVKGFSRSGLHKTPR